VVYHLLDVLVTRQSPYVVRPEDGRAATWWAVGSLDDRWQRRSVKGQLRRYGDAVRSVLAIVQLGYVPTRDVHGIPWVWDPMGPMGFPWDPWE